MPAARAARFWNRSCILPGVNHQPGSFCRGADMSSKRRLFRNVVIVSEHEGHSRVDREVVKGLGAEIMAVFTTGREAEAYIGNHRADLVICDKQLADMDGYAFMRRLREHPVTANLPVVMATLENDELAVLEAIASGCSGYLLRPYSIDTFERQAETARKIRRLPEAVTRWAAQLKARKEEAEAVEASGNHKQNARGFFQEGSRHLLNESWDKAIAAFEKAVELNEAYAEAWEGMAQAYRGLKSKPRFLEHLTRAAKHYAWGDRYIEVRMLHGEILREGGHMANPFVTVAKTQWKEQDWEAGLLAWRRAAMLTPEDEEVQLGLVMAHLERGNVEQALSILELALEENPDFEQLRGLRDQLTGERPATLLERALMRLDDLRESLRQFAERPVASFLPKTVQRALNEERPSLPVAQPEMR